MRIEDLGRERDGDRTRVRAMIRFEHCDLPDREVYVDATGPVGEDLEPSPDAFLLMGLPLACWMGERRVRVEGCVCTRLREGLEEAMRLYAHWYERAGPVEVEATAGFRPTRPRAERRTSALLSGGVDSLAMLEANRDAYPVDHPDAIREAIFLRGINTLDFDEDGRLRPAYARSYEALSERLRGLARSMDFELTVLDTNVRLLFPSWPVFRDLAWGAAFLAPSQMLGTRLTDVLIASTGVGLPNRPHASHPALDPLYSTAAVRVRQPLPFLPRFEKLARVASWPEGLRVLDVCLRMEDPAVGTANCGRCHKCVRTMLGLCALGRLADAETFPLDDVRAEMVKAAPIVNDALIGHMESMLGPLERRDRGDLAEAIRRDVRRFRARRKVHRRIGRAIGRVFRGRVTTAGPQDGDRP